MSPKARPSDSVDWKSYALERYRLPSPAPMASDESSDLSTLLVLLYRAFLPSSKKSLLGKRHVVCARRAGKPPPGSPDDVATPPDMDGTLIDVCPDYRQTAHLRGAGYPASPFARRGGGSST